MIFTWGLSQSKLASKDRWCKFASGDEMRRTTAELVWWIWVVRVTSFVSLLAFCSRNCRKFCLSGIETQLLNKPHPQPLINCFRTKRSGYVLGSPQLVDWYKLKIFTGASSSMSLLLEKWVVRNLGLLCFSDDLGKWEMGLRVISSFWGVRTIQRGIFGILCSFLGALTEAKIKNHKNLLICFMHITYWNSAQNLEAWTLY